MALIDYDTNTASLGMVMTISPFEMVYLFFLILFVGFCATCGPWPRREWFEIVRKALKAPESTFTRSHLSGLRGWTAIA
jgi:hypothetical protein